MNIYNENMELLTESVDLSKGRLEERNHTIHHDAVAAVKEKFHYKTIKVYPNGGKDMEKVIDVEGVEGQEAWDEEVTVQVYVPYTQAELDLIKSQEYQPTQLDRLEAQVAYIAMMTDLLLEE